MEVMVSEYFAYGFFTGLLIIFLVWIGHRFYKWVVKVNDILLDLRSSNSYNEERIDNLTARMKKLEDQMMNEENSQEKPVV